ncbi:hypothetical protein [Phytomonospora endophytica]|uniref:DUF3168 domain-containing protein n=1 Tax=Phytomonospora endophytica TaxID=714109 RepID=A0A841G2G4_9ACTN|nr:hypothetical protein [Phytomonospora endophytica]MBB6038330.1 hypothetical protein [Phytomonospora endophytica]GIG64260.1 hypothetical protein Pen01_05550 [Phytomonospora endophytica]
MQQQTRQAIANALSSVDGITGYGHMPDTPAPFDGWPEWVQTVPRGGCADGAAITWHALVVLPAADSTTAIDAADPLVASLLDALTEVGTVELIDPVQIAGTDTAGNLVPGLRIRLTT